jgi:hypothetical protein
MASRWRRYGIKLYLDAGKLTLAYREMAKKYNPNRESSKIAINNLMGG